MEVLRHLGDVGEMRQMRFDRILAEDNPLSERAVPRPGERDSEDDVLRSPGGVDPREVDVRHGDPTTTTAHLGAPRHARRVAPVVLRAEVRNGRVVFTPPASPSRGGWSRGAPSGSSRSGAV